MGESGPSQMLWVSAGTAIAAIDGTVSSLLKTLVSSAIKGSLQLNVWNLQSNEASSIRGRGMWGLFLRESLPWEMSHLNVSK